MRERSSFYLKIPCGLLGYPYLGEAIAAARAALPCPTNVYGVLTFTYFAAVVPINVAQRLRKHPPALLSISDYLGIFYVRDQKYAGPTCVSSSSRETGPSVQFVRQTR